MIGDSTLRKIVGADFLTSISAADLQKGDLARSSHAALSLLHIQQSCFKNFERLRFILVLRFFIVAHHHHIGRQMRDPNRRIGSVHTLSAGS